MNKKGILNNTISSIVSYGILLIVSIVSSKLILVTYGSEANGLLSSVNQLFSYIALLEAGIGTATVTALYRPIADADSTSIKEVLASSNHYYRISAKWYFICMLIVAAVWPLLLETEISYIAIFGIIFFQGVSGVITYWYTSTVVNYLMASGKNYINNYVHLASSLLTYGLKIIICLTQQDIIFMALALVVGNCLKCLIYYVYLKWSCPEYAYIGITGSKKELKQRNSFLIHEISGVVFSSTDTIILSVFCGLKEASVYAVYALVLNALRMIIGQAFNSTNFILGNSYSKDQKNYPLTHDKYNGVYTCVVFIVFTIAYWMILPFIGIYTQGVTDANYLDPKLPILFVLIEVLSACRIVDGQLIKNAYHSKQTLSHSIIEAAINLVVSLVAVQFLGIYGVLLGTIVALLYRVNDIIFYANTKILKRSPLREYGMYALNFALFTVCVCVSRYIPIAVNTYLQWIGYAVGIGIVVSVVFVVANFIFLRCMLRAKY